MAGDGLDNDCDGKIDEEIKDGKDNDGDGSIDEDLDLVSRLHKLFRILFNGVTTFMILHTTVFKFSVGKH